MASFVPNRSEMEAALANFAATGAIDSRYLNPNGTTKDLSFAGGGPSAAGGPQLGAQGQQQVQQQQAQQQPQQGLLPGAQGPIADIFRDPAGLNRDPDASGLAFWRQQLANGVPIEQIQASITASPENTQRQQATGIPTGLLGSEQALQQGLAGALSGLEQGINTGRNDLFAAQQAGQQALQAGITQGRSDLQAGQQQIGQTIGSGVSALQQFVPVGVDAQSLQGALSGASGAEAQAQAFQNFQDSPGQAFLRERGERAVTGNSAALGGLGGGRVQQELQRQGIGFANQAFNDRFAQLGQLSNQGLQATGQQAQLRGQEASIQGSLASQLGNLGLQGGVAGSNLQQNIGGQLAGLAQTGGLTAAQLAQQTGNNLSIGRTRVGEQIAGAVGDTSSGLANLINQQGSGLSDLTGASAGNLANLLSGAGLSQDAGQQQLATLLANLATGSGSTIAGLPGIPGLQEFKGIAGNLAAAAEAGGTAAAAASDERLKENITPYGKSAGGHNLYTWDWTEEGSKIAGNQPTFGVIAQEAAQLTPSAVSVGADGFLRVDYTRIH